MKLTFLGHDHRYAVEQMLLMLLPGEPIVYEGDDPNRLEVALAADHARASLLYRGAAAEGTVATGELGLDTPDDQKAVEQHLVKLAVYRAVTQLRPAPVWGALSGVRPAKLATKWLRKGATAEQVTDLLTGLYRLSPDKAALTLRCAGASLEADALLAPNDIGLYIGIPFCPTRCAYCSFISADVAGNAPFVGPYVEALAGELAQTGDLLRRRGLRLRAVYMGGGTPTTLSAPQLDTLLAALDGWLDRGPLLEFTVEAGRPDTITAEKLAVLKAHGVDRVSVNPQTMEAHVLAAMGRAHTPDQFLRAYDLADKAGFTINTDLIAGLPKDTPEGFRRSLDTVIALGAAEITVHTLALKHGSALLQRPEDLPGEEETAAMLAYAHTALPAAGYSPYYLYRQKYMTGALENVGWTKRERGSLYNIIMMEELRSVLALGAGGVTKTVDRARGQIKRRPNAKYPREYLDRLEDTMKEREAIQWPIN